VDAPSGTGFLSSALIDCLHVSACFCGVFSLLALMEIRRRVP